MEKNFWVAFQGNLGNFTADINSVAFSPDGRMIAGGINESEVICIWNATTGEKPQIHEGKCAECFALGQYRCFQC